MCASISLYTSAHFQFFLHFTLFTDDACGADDQGIKNEAAVTPRIPKPIVDAS